MLLAPAEYLPGCLAHLIKGAIFFFYGLLTFARYLGAFAELGWAWNVRPHPRPRGRRSSEVLKGRSTLDDQAWASRWQMPTAEAVESFVIFVYGLTNTWMERESHPPRSFRQFDTVWRETDLCPPSVFLVGFGAEAGSPYTVHQVQHISIALMFFGGGLMGLALESSYARRLLVSSVVNLDGRRLSKIDKPPTWSGSFNPFPALVIGLVSRVHHTPLTFRRLS